MFGLELTSQFHYRLGLVGRLMSHAGPLIMFVRDRIVADLHSQIALQLVVNDDAIGTRLVAYFDLIVDWCDILK